MNTITSTEVYYVTEVRRPGYDWAKVHVARTAMDAAEMLTDALTTHGVRGSDLHGVRDDLAAGHPATTDGGYSFRVQARHYQAEGETR